MWGPGRPGAPAPVALLAEGVDRNVLRAVTLNIRLSSPSSRRAWIEIVQENTENKQQDVALLAEGVDRNWNCYEKS